MAGWMEELFRAYWPLAVGYLARRTGSTTLAEELVHETFYLATRGFLGWRGGSPVAWLLAPHGYEMFQKGGRRDQDRARDLNRGSSKSVTCGLGGCPGGALSRRV